MRLSKPSYYADFVVYAAVLTAAAIATVWHDTARQLVLWILAVVIGAMLWTLAEYGLHRFVLHRVAPFAQMHKAHHRMPLALIGTPTVLSLGIIFGAVFLPARALTSINIAVGLTVGIMAGFLWYGVVHHAIHHSKPRTLAMRLRLATRRHAQHHYSGESGNFGVSTSLWDYLFGTALNATRQFAGVRQLRGGIRQSTSRSFNRL